MNWKYLGKLKYQAYNQLMIFKSSCCCFVHYRNLR